MHPGSLLFFGLICSFLFHVSILSSKLIFYFLNFTPPCQGRGRGWVCYLISSQLWKTTLLSCGKPASPLGGPKHFIAPICFSSPSYLFIYLSTHLLIFSSSHLNHGFNITLEKSSGRTAYRSLHWGLQSLY